MCECGCGDFHPHQSFLMGDDVLSVEVYRGCDNCDTGLMVTLYKMSPSEAERWDIEEFSEFDRFGMVNIPLLHPEDLIEALKEIQEADEYDNFADFLSDHGLDLIQRAVEKRLKARP